MDIAEYHLVQLSRDGDQNAFQELMQQYKDRIGRLAYRMLHNRHDSEDIVQETFIKVYLKLNDYDPTQRFSSWIYRIGKNLCIDLLRRRRHIESLDSESSGEDGSTYYEKLADPDLTPDHLALQAELHSHIHDAIGKLPPKYQSIVTLYYLEEMSFQEISEVLQLPAGTIKSRLHRGRELLRKKWGLTLLFHVLLALPLIFPW